MRAYIWIGAVLAVTTIGMLATAKAGQCFTNCSTYGNQTSCVRNCY